MTKLLSMFDPELGLTSMNTFRVTFNQGGLVRVYLRKIKKGLQYPYYNHINFSSSY